MGRVLASYICLLVLYKLGHLAEVENAGCKGGGGCEKLLNLTPCHLELVSHVPHGPLFPQVVQHQCQIEAAHSKLVYGLLNTAKENL